MGCFYFVLKVKVAAKCSYFRCCTVRQDFLLSRKVFYGNGESGYAKLKEKRGGKVKGYKWLFACFFLLCLLFLSVFYPHREETVFLGSAALRPGYATLSEEEQVLYDQVRAVIEALAVNVSLGEGVKSDTFHKVVEYIQLDYPEIFWLSPQYEVVTSEDGELMYEAHFSYTFTKEEISARRWELEQCLQKIVRQTGTGVDGLRFLHDHLIDHVQYDSDGADTYSTLVLGKGNCQGYAKAFQLLANREGYACITVMGEAGGVKHSWNLVKVNGEVLYVDATWDDPLLRGDTVLSEQDRYRYFLIGEETLFLDHSLPQATPYQYPISIYQ